MNAETIVKMLEEPIEDRRPLVRQIEATASTGALIEALRQSRLPLTRNILCDVLGARHAKAAVNELLLTLRDPTPAVRASAADALAKIADPASGKVLYDQLSVEADKGVRQMLVLALGSVGYKDAVTLLIRLLTDPDETTRGCAAWSLSALEAKNALMALEDALSVETGSYARLRMQEALKELDR